MEHCRGGQVGKLNLRCLTKTQVYEAHAVVAVDMAGGGDGAKEDEVRCVR